MRKIILLAMALILAAGLIFAWAEEVKERNQPIDEKTAEPIVAATKASSVVEDVALPGINKAAPVTEVLPALQRPTAAPAVEVPEAPKWEPIYGEKGELLNPIPTIETSQPIVNPAAAGRPSLPEEPQPAGTGGGGEPPVSLENTLFYERFSNPQGWGYGVPPQNVAGTWTVLDSGYYWDNYDWNRYASTTWGVALARVMGTATTRRNDNWLISPAIDFSSATNCTLAYRYYYDDVSPTTEDSGFVYVSGDNGQNWTQVVLYVGADSGTISAPKTNRIDISAIAAGKSQVKAAFRYLKDTTLVGAGNFGVDNVEFRADGNQLYFENMDATGWGASADGLTWTPPSAGWTQPHGADGWNNNDWHAYWVSGWSDTVANVYYSPTEKYCDWLITPSLNLSGKPYVRLSFNQYYDDYSGASDTAYVYGTTDDWATKVLIARFVDVDYGSTTARNYQEFDISSWAANQSNVKIGFKYVGLNTSYGWYVDDVRVFEPNADDIAASSILLPPTTIYAGAKYPVAGVVQSIGTSGQTFDVIMRADTLTTGVGTFWADTVYSVYLGPYQIDTVEFDSFLTTQADTFRFVMTVINPGDELTTNDSTSKTVYAPIVLPLHDVRTLAVNSPTFVTEARNWPINIKVDNYGQNTETFQDSTYIIKINKNILMFEEFSNPQGWTGANPPVNPIGTWTIIDSGSVPGTWNNNDWHAYWNSSWMDTIARVYYSPVEYQNEWLITPSINCATVSNVHLGFKLFYDDYSGASDTGWVLGTDDDWGTTYVIAMYVDADVGSSTTPAIMDYDISAWAAGKSNVKIAFKYKGYNALYCMNVDEVMVYEQLAPTVSYSSGETVNNLAPLEVRNVAYTATWNNPTAGEYQLVTFTNLGTDLNPANDTLRANLVVYPHVGSGGPDAGNYEFKDDISGGGPAYNWIDITIIGTPLTLPGSGDDRYTRVGIGFNFPYYSGTYDRVSISENGWISFDSATSAYNSNAAIPNSAAPNNIIALFWDDLKQGTAGSIYTYTSPTADTFIISYLKFTSYASTATDTLDAQVILTADRKIKMQYRRFGPGITTSHTIGIENADGTTGLQYIYNGSPMGNVPIAPLAITFYYNPPAIDVVVLAITEPGTWPLRPRGYTITASVWNNSSVATVLDSLEFKVLGANPFLSTSYNLAMNANETTLFSSAAQWFPTVTSTDTIVVTAYHSSDGNPANNVRMSTRMVKAPFAFPYLEDVEPTLDGWVGAYIGTGMGWYVTTSRYHSYNHSTYLSNSPYPRDAFIVSPPIDLSSAVNPRLYFWESWGTNAWGSDPNERHVVMVMTGDFDWVLDTLLLEDPSSWYIPPAFGQDPVYIDMSAYAGDTVWLVFQKHVVASNGCSWYLDDIGIESAPNHDVYTSAINSPGIFMSTGRNWPISVKVGNRGLNPESFHDTTKILQFNKNVLLFEEFSNPQGWTGANPPVNVAGTWTVIDSGLLQDGWNNNDWHAYWYSTWSDTIARVYWSPIEQQNEWLITPALNCASASNVYLSFNQYYADFTTDLTDTGFVLGTTDNWNTVQVIAMYTSSQGSSSTPTRFTYNISSWAAGQANVKVAFKYVGNDDLYWYVDEVEVYEMLPPTYVYQSGEFVNNLAPYELRDVPYSATWNDPPAGNYQLVSYTCLGTDEVPSNDTLRRDLTVYLHVGTGGPDGAGYMFFDNINGGGPAYSWIDISGIGTPVTWAFGSSDDRWTGGMALGFDFPFYGRNYGRIFLSENGVLSFDSLTTSYLTNYSLPSTSGPRNALALLWDDLYLKGDGAAYYYSNGLDTFIISVDNWSFYSTTDSMHRFDAQVILTRDGTIKFQYKDVGPYTLLSNTVGIQDSTRSIGLTYVYNGVPMGNKIIGGEAITFYQVFDAIAVSLDSPPELLMSMAPVPVRATFRKDIGGDIVGAIAYAAVLGPSGQEFFATVPGVNIGTTPVQVDFGTWAPSTDTSAYTITAWIVVAGERDTLDNRVTSYTFVLDTLGAFGHVALTLGDSADFTLDPATGPMVLVGNPWNWGDDDLILPIPSGRAKCWGTRHEVDYDNEDCGGIVSRDVYIDPSWRGWVAIRFWFDNAANDFANVSISTDGGSSWTLLVPVFGYTAQDPGNPSCPLVANEFGFTGSSGGWIRKIFDLRDYSGQTVKLRVDFGSDLTSVDRGTYVDDFVFFGPLLGFQYVPGDANMLLGFWPPTVNAADVSYLVAWFAGRRPFQSGCMFDNPAAPPGWQRLWASADANGSCGVSAADVTRLVSYFKSGTPPIQYCPDYPPITPVQATFPACQAGPPARTIKVLPSQMQE